MAHINVTYTWTMSTQIKQKHGAHSNTYKVRISANFMERSHFYVRHTQNNAKLKATKTTINLQNEEKIIPQLKHLKQTTLKQSYIQYNGLNE